MFFKKGKKGSATEQAEPVVSNTSEEAAPVPEDNESTKKQPWWASIKEPGSALQIITAALIAIAIGLAVATQVDEVPEAARVIISIPGDLWLRSLKAVGMFQFHSDTLKAFRLTMKSSSTPDCLLHASRCATTPNHVKRRQLVGTLDNRLLCVNHASVHLDLMHYDLLGLGTALCQG